MAGTQTLQQHIDSYYRFTMRLNPRKDFHCRLVDPLCQLLLAEPDLALKPRTPKEWAQLLRDYLGDRWDADSPLDFWAVRDCFRHHRHLLEERLDIVKTPNPSTPGSVYQLSLCANTSEVVEVECETEGAAQEAIS